MPVKITKTPKPAEEELVVGIVALETVVDDAPEVELDTEALAPDVDAIGVTMLAVEKAEKAVAAKAEAELAKLALLKTKLKEQTAKLAEKVNTAYLEANADKKYTVNGKKYRAIVGAKGTERTIKDMVLVKKLFDKQDKELFLKLAKINLGDIDKYLTPEEKDAALNVERVARSLKVEVKP